MRRMLAALDADNVEYDERVPNDTFDALQSSSINATKVYIKNVSHIDIVRDKVEGVDEKSLKVEGYNF